MMKLNNLQNHMQKISHNMTKTNSKKYVVGIILSNDLKYTYLIRKNRPKKQIGYLNGVGGKIEDNENSLTAIKRESLEECGYKGFWYPINIIDNVKFYYSIMNSNSSEPITKTDEKIEKINNEKIELLKNEIYSPIYDYIKKIIKD